MIDLTLPGRELLAQLAALPRRVLGDNAEPRFLALNRECWCRTGRKTPGSDAGCNSTGFLPIPWAEALEPLIVIGEIIVSRYAGQWLGMVMHDDMPHTAAEGATPTEAAVRALAEAVNILEAINA